MPKEKESIYDFQTRVSEMYPGVFRAEKHILRCLFCNCRVFGARLFNIKQHIVTKKHVVALAKGRKPTAHTETFSTEIQDEPETKKENQTNSTSVNMHPANRRSGSTQKQTLTGEDGILNLLSLWDLQELHDVFKEEGITVRSLKYLTDEDISGLIPKVGTRRVFCAMLNEWRERPESQLTNVPQTPPPPTTESRKRNFDSISRNEVNDFQDFVEPLLIKSETSVDSDAGAWLAADHDVIYSEERMRNNESVSKVRKKQQEHMSISTHPQAYEYNGQPQWGFSAIQDIGLNNLLVSWELPHLYNVLNEQNVNIRILKIMKSKYIEKLLKNSPIVDQILFEYNFDLWRTNLGIPAQAPSTNVEHFSELSNSSLVSSNTEVSSNKEVQSYTLKTILKETRNGKMITNYYDQHKTLHEEQRNLLISTIASYIESKGCNLSLAESAQIEKEIIDFFPTERIEFYTNGRRGRIYNKVANLKYRSKPLFTPKESTSTQSTVITPEPDAESIVALIRCDGLSAEEFPGYWKRCCRYRFNQITQSNSIDEILIKWPEYKRPSGYRLIDIDFTLKYPTSTSLTTTWPQTAEKIVGILRKKVINSAITELLQKLDDYSEDSRDLVILWALHGLFPPQSKTVTGSCGTKIKKRYSINDSQDSFLIVGRTFEEIENKLQIIKLQRKNIQPCLLVVGDMLNVGEIYLYLDDARFPMLSSVRAADMLFKTFCLFNFDFPEESSIFYNFIQTYFYNIPSSHKNPRVFTFINELNSME